MAILGCGALLACSASRAAASHASAPSPSARVDEGAALTRPPTAPRPAPQPGSPGGPAQNFLAAPAIEPSEAPIGQATRARTPRAAPLLVYEATLTLAVFDQRRGLDRVEAIAKSRGGYLLSRNDHSIIVRVPAEAFGKTLEEIAQTGDELSRTVSARDVTDQFSDLSTRLRNAEAMRERLAALLEKVDAIKDALAVEQQLERVTLQIESLKGQLKRLRELISYSTITVRYQPRPVDPVEARVELPFEWLHQLGLPHLLELRR